MIDWTDRHDRYFLRLISKQTLLYTEMITTGAIIHGDKERHLGFNTEEHPIAVQLGGSNPSDLAQCSKICEDYGYDEINLNVGCPSDRVQSGAFGACLMAQPDLVAECIDHMKSACDLPITIKCRIGIDDQDEYEDLQRFVLTTKAAGCETFIVHARKAWLQGLSPKENRDIPPLNYERVYQLKREFPELEIIINGGIKTLDECKSHLNHVDGVMMGREAYQNPFILANVDHLFFDSTDKHISSVPLPLITRHDIIEKMICYIDELLANGGQLKWVSRHILGIFQGMPGARAWRRHLSQNAYKKDATSEVIREALKYIDLPSD
ncbi:tRNA dihydrouridine(20/20a) synthase DusA [Gammaproteobacteria bacterium 42_54_T18]|nr:tRNA dihydrouridine(20/20a) synthase DusA [Gammaproteobacteria bacterium 42_54_T18]